MTDVRLLTGTDPAALEAAALNDYVCALDAAHRTRDPGRLLWISPSSQSRRAVLGRLVQKLGHTCVAPGVTTFDGFAEFLLRAASQPATAISSMVRRLLLRRLVRESLAAGELPYFAGVAGMMGFLDVVENFIAEMKRDEIWPERFLETCGRHSDTAARDLEVGRLYQRYQSVLHEHDWYDAEGRFWLARTSLVSGQCAHLPRWTQIAVVGFADFTPPQREILEALSHRTGKFVLTIPGEASDIRQDLFAKPSQTERDCRARFRQATVVPVGAAVKESAARTTLRQNLFGNQRRHVQVPADGDIEIVAATGPESELSAVAVRIKSLIRCGHAPQDIIVGVRSSPEDVFRWKQGLEHCGLPVWSDQGPPLRECGLVKFLIAVLLAEVENWSFHRLQAVVNSSYFRPLQPENAVSDSRAVASSLRRLRLPGDRRAILQALPHGEPSTQHNDPTLPDDDVVVQRDVAWPAVHAAAGRLLRWYSQLTEPLRRSRPLSEWLDVIADLMLRLGAVNRTSAESLDIADYQLWERLQRTLRDAAAADSGRPALDVAEFLAEFRDLLASEYCEPEPEPPGVVRVMSVEPLRHVDTPVLFLVGMTENSFPRGRSEDCLFSESDRRRLSHAGLPMKQATQQHQDELFLFFVLLQRWHKRLVLTYPAVNTRGQPTFPSPYVTALRSLFTPDSLSIQEEGQLDPVPAPTHIVSETDRRLAAWDAARRGRPGWLKTLWTESLSNSASVAAAVEMAVQRFDTPGFSSYEGRLSVAANLQGVAKRFGPQRQFSATELEAYANCPFRFWLGTVLGVAGVSDAEVGTDHRERGSLVHDVLSRLSADIDAGRGGEELACRFREMVEDRLQRTVATSELQRALTRIERQLLDRWAEAYADQCGLYASQMQDISEERWRVLDTEFPFGDVPGAPEEAKERPLRFGDATNQVQVRGRIDRIDVGLYQGRPAFTVIDYKTGQRPRVSDRDVESGRALQLMLYALAVKRLGLAPADALPFQLGYWCLKETGFQAGMGSRARQTLKPIDSAAWESLEKLVDQIVPQLATAIRCGEFVVDNPDENCGGMCDYRTICRVNQIRPLAQKLVKLRTPLATEPTTKLTEKPKRKSSR